MRLSFPTNGPETGTPADRDEVTTARWVSVATMALAAGLAVLLVIVLYGDFQDRRDQRALIAQGSQDALQRSLDDFEVELTRRVAVADDAGHELADLLDGAGSQPDVALAGAVIEAELARVLPALDQVIYQDPVAQLVGVDRFGSPTPSPLEAGFDIQVAMNRTAGGAFANDQGRVFLEDGVAAYYPVGEDAAGGWVVLILRGDQLAVESTFVRIASASEQIQPSIQPAGEHAELTAAVPFAGSTFVATRSIATPGGAPPGWLPLIVLALGAAASLAGVVVLGNYVRRNHQVVAARPLPQNPVTDTGPRSSTTDFEQTIIGVVEIDHRAAIISVNQAYCDQVRRERSDLIGASLLSLTEPADRPRHVAALEKLVSGEAQTTQVEHRILTGDEENETWVLEHLSTSQGPEGPRILVQSQDITFRRYATWELAKQALHDELTGLANRAMLVHRLRGVLSETDAVASVGGEPPLVGVMFIDVDRFKMVNDSLGHEAGDRLIRYVGERLQLAVREKDTVSRFGGDEFVVLCDSLADADEAMMIAERIRASLDTPFVDDGTTIQPTLSIGVAMCRAGEMAADDLLRDADAAMYRAKERGRDRVEVFDEGMRQMIAEQMTLEVELRQAIDDEAFAMYFQPIVDSSTYATAGFEALVRWPHPTRGLLTPAQFLDAAEAAGLQGKLDMLGLKIACSQMARWAARFPLANQLYISANKVPRDFPDFVQEIREIVASTGLPPGLLVVEVVERALLDDVDAARQAMDDLREMGVRVAIDDFGTGYSSLSYLTRFRPTMLKIERDFVSMLPDDSGAASMVQAITEMATALGITVVAEGVETWEQAEALRIMGVPYFQGYLFAKPRPAKEVEDWFIEIDSPPSAAAVAPDPAAAPGPAAAPQALSADVTAGG